MRRRELSAENAGALILGRTEVKQEDVVVLETEGIDAFSYALKVQMLF